MNTTESRKDEHVRIAIEENVKSSLVNETISKKLIIE